VRIVEMAPAGSLSKGLAAIVLDKTVREAPAFFEWVPAFRGKLETLNDVGLGYIHLGQPATQISKGEAQRVKLSRELSPGKSAGSVASSPSPR
jgi:excinuclease UvrABC ATPase subunit